METDAQDKIELDNLLSKLRPFQREAFNFATKQSKDGTGGTGKLLIADEMGLGKTVTSLAIMLAYKSEWPLLILCPASLRYTWPAEIEKFCPELPHSAVYVVKGFDDCDFYSNPNKRARIKIVVATYSLLQNRSAAARVLQEFRFKCIIADESHNLKEKTSQRCKLAMPLLSRANRLLLLSGTPALARPVELWAQLNCINQDLFGSYTHFTKTYCNARRGRFGWDVSGLKNADELHEKLKTVMVRRLKADVLKELPPKQRSIVPVKIQKSEHVKECKDIVAQLTETRLSVSSLVGDDASNAQFEARSLLMRAYQASGIGKAQAVAEYVIDWLSGSGTQKVLVFAHHKEVLDTIEAAVSKHLKGVGHIRIDGSVAPIDRAARVKKFQNIAQVRLALLSVTAAGVGLTLTAASSVIFAELHWTPGVLAQAEDRCHRMGQVNAVNIMYCVCKETDLSVDLSLWKMLGRKVSNLGRIIDGERDASMNALDAENGAPSEQELASFFADTCPDDPSSGDKKAPVKGSIQSFFKKPSPAPASSSKSLVKMSSKPVSNPKITVTPDASKSPFHSAKKGNKRSLPDSTSTSASKPSKTSQLSSWGCKVCTFVNESNASTCDMCGTPGSSEMIQIDCSSAATESLCPMCTCRNENNALYCAACNASLSQNVAQDESQCIESDDIMEVSDDVILSCNATSSQNSQAISPSVPTPPSSQSQIIDIIDDSDDSKNEVIEITSAKRFKPEPKKQRSSPILNSDSGEESTTEANLLSFSVSKNSGRVAIHHADSGESLLVNFDIEQLVKESTSDELLNRQLKRSAASQSVSSAQVLFEENAVELGKCTELSLYSLLSS